MCSYKNLYLNIYGSIIHDNQKMEAAQISKDKIN